MKRITFSGIFLIIIVATFFSCKKEDLRAKARRFRKEELAQLDSFITKNYPDVKPTASGLYFIETRKGTGDTIKIGDRVQIYYAVWSIDSFLIDETVGYLEGLRYEPYELIVGAKGTIVGLQEGLTYMQPGAKANLVINSELAYGDGSSSSSPLPGFMTLLYEVEVYKVFPLKTSN